MNDSSSKNKEPSFSIGKRKSDEVDGFDEDVACVTCHDLVVNATQTPCCGSLFCRTCILEWVCAQKSCPCCRKLLSGAELIADVRTERKSACYPRSCKFKGEGCYTIGTRNEMSEHEKSCQFVPRTILNEKIDGLNTKLAESNILVSQLQAEVERLKAEKLKVIEEHVSLRVTSAFQSPEAIIRSTYKVAVVRQYQAGKESYKFPYKPTDYGYKLVIAIANFNVSLKLYCTDRAEAAHLEKIQVTLFHPDGPSKNKTTNVEANFLKDDKRGYGVATWMSEDEMKSFCRNDKFFVGISRPHSNINRY
eukprot:gene6961-9385_t